MVFAIHVFFSSDFFADQFFKFFGLFQMSCSVAMFQLCLHFLHSHLILSILFVVLKCNVNMEKNSYEICLDPITLSALPA